MILSDALCREADADGSAIFSHGFTYAGHPVACAAALTNLRIIETEKICAGVRELAPYFQQRLRALGSLPIVGDVRGMGLIAGVELVANRAQRQSFRPDVAIAQRIALACRARGVIVRPLGTVIGISPPLTITRAHVDILADVLHASIVGVADELVTSGIPIGE
jgi:putrescine aminotransferase